MDKQGCLAGVGKEQADHQGAPVLVVAAEPGVAVVTENQPA